MRTAVIFLESVFWARGWARGDRGEKLRPDAYVGLGPGPGALGACALGRRKGCLGLKHGMARLEPWKRGRTRLEPWEGGVTGPKQWKKGYSVRLEKKSPKNSLKILAMA